MTSSKDFFVSLEILQTLSKLTPNSLQTHKEIFAWYHFHFLKKRGKMSLENLETLSKLSPKSKKYACTTFFQKNNACSHSKKVVHAFFFQFGKILEILQTHSSFFCLFFEKWHQAKISFVSLEILQARSELICFHCLLLFHCFFGKGEWVWSEFGDSSNSPQTRSKLIFSFYFICFGGKRGMSLEWVWRFSKLSPNSLQTRSKLKWFHFLECFSFCFFSCLFGKDERFRSEFGDYPNSLQTRSKLICFHFFRCHFLFYLYIFWTRGMSLEWVWRFSRLSPNSYVFFNFFSLEKRNEFGVTLEILQTLSKLTPNSLQTQRISFFLFYLLFFGKRGMSLERVWRVSKLSPNSVQTRSKLMFFLAIYVTLCHNPKNC